ncbi:tRNA1(Val) (adenine(37)-N6)-methyltransferase [Methylobacterium sp. E-045]|uniref:tRNA1(Val) (adenine(37)-N6)-methyltransferase n=1 Tax=Methylobacterium sp. E-045 TaxID=2836575 RepID=UPI001FBBA497|nr:methyltransferase [Methylobacterium sp. E-045]MCJ2132001.1 methyltransferase [Methylobacterium sp. E-045]
MPEFSTEAATADLWLGGRLRLHQPPRGAHRAGTDAVLLSRLVKPPPGAVVVDVGSATGAVGLAMAAYEATANVVLVERDPDLAVLAARNIDENGVDGRVRVIAADILSIEGRRTAGLSPNMAELVLTNPPFFESGRHRPSPVPGKASAHTFSDGDLESWLKACLDLLKPGGTLGLVHRADALPDCLAALHRRFGGIVVRPVQARSERPAIRVLVTGIKGSHAPFSLAPPLILQGTDGAMTPEADALHRGLPWPS